jgi:hypothetical protein
MCYYLNVHSQGQRVNISYCFSLVLTFLCLYFYLLFVLLYCSLNEMLAQPKNFHLGFNTTTELKNSKSTSDNTRTLLSQNISRQMSLLSNVFVVCLS